VRLLNVCTAVGCIGLALLFGGPDLSAQIGSTRPHKRVGVERLRPHADTEAKLDEMWLTTDEDGRHKITMSGGLEKGKVERLFWAVDSRDHTYTVVRLTGNHADDATRIQKVYKRLGYDTPVNAIADKLWRHHVSIEDTRRKLKEQAQSDAAAFWLDPPVDENGHRLGGPSAGCEAGGGQYAQVCYGSGFADVQTWEPAKYFFNVDYLNETLMTASWLHNVSTGGIYAVSPGGFCWSNAQTFAGTHWYTNACIPSSTLSTDYLDLARVGQYYNDDFSFILFGVHHRITITSEASVQSINGTGNWGALYYEDVEAWLHQWYEPFFLSGILFGEASEGDCGPVCDPSPAELSDCQDARQGTWDYGLCQCVTDPTPIIIDLENDDLHLTSAANGVMFDIKATGQPMKLGWTRAGSDDAFLVLDRNHNGTIDDGTELFGNYTPQPEVKKKGEKNGFRALAVFDEPAQAGNGDGQITAADAIYSSLRLWKDLNHDGISQPNELETLEAEGLRAISLHYVRSRQTDQYGNQYRYRGHVTMDRHAFAGGTRRQAIDVFLVTAQTNTTH
jgi:hypothetical protein